MEETREHLFVGLPRPDSGCLSLLLPPLVALILSVAVQRTTAVAWLVLVLVQHALVLQVVVRLLLANVLLLVIVARLLAEVLLLAVAAQPANAAGLLDVEAL